MIRTPSESSPAFIDHIVSWRCWVALGEKFRLSFFGVLVIPKLKIYNPAAYPVIAGAVGAKDGPGALVLVNLGPAAAFNTIFYLEIWLYGYPHKKIVHINRAAVNDACG